MHALAEMRLKWHSAPVVQQPDCIVRAPGHVACDAGS
jgi:hypothetical protein